MSPAPVISHGGVHRTGTTSLQRSLSKRRAAQATFGVAYPGDEANHRKLAPLDRHAASTAAVARTFFGREALFPEPPPVLDDPCFSSADIPHQNLMRAWVAPVTQALLRA